MLERWEGRRTRVLLTHRPSLQRIEAVPKSIMQRIEPMAEDLTGLAGEGLGLTFSDADGAVIFTLLVHEQLLDDAIEGDRELPIWLHHLEVIIQELTGG
jgi:hypothetical protein